VKGREYSDDDFWFSDNEEEFHWVPQSKTRKVYVERVV
jgi:hypothetical protein